MRPHCLLFTIVLLLAIIEPYERLEGQEINETNFTNFTREHGLSNNIITGIVQDSVGYIWIATAAGLNRFDGSNFVQFHSTNDSLSLPQEGLNGLVWLDKHRLAVYSTGGLHIINTATGERHNLFVPYPDKLYQYRFNNVRSVTSDPSGNIFLLTYSGFYQFDKNYNLTFRFDYYKNDQIATASSPFGRKLLWLDQKHLAIISGTGLYYYDVEKKRIKKMEAGDYPVLGDFLDYPQRDYSFFQPSQGRLFILGSDSDSLTYIDLTEKKKTIARLPFHLLRSEFDYRSDMIAINDTLLYITGKLSGFYKMTVDPASGAIQFYPKKYFPTYYCHRVMEDRNHNLWVATNKGVLTQDNNRSFIQQGSLPASLQTLYPNILIEDVYPYGDKLYVTTRGKGGMLVFDKEKLTFIRRIGFEKFWREPASIYAVMAADNNNNNLLVAVNGPLCWLNTVSENITEIVPDKWNKDGYWTSDLYKDRASNIWIAANNIYKYDGTTHKFSVMAMGEALNKIERVQRIQEDTSGNIWFAGHGLLRYNVHTNKLDREVDSFPFIKMLDKQINSFLADDQDNLWFNSNNNGLICYSIDKGSFRHFTTNDGLPDNNIAAMIIVRNKLWIATFSGIACLDLETFKINSFGEEDGFPGSPISIGAKFFYDSHINKLYIGFSNAVVKFDPDIVSQKTPSPSLFIESLTTADQKKHVLPGNRFETSWRNNEITITIGSINFFTNNTQRFGYRLLNNNNDQWQQLGGQNTFSISNLSPGEHTIQVKLSSLSNRWPEQVSEIHITVLPPFWEQVWFRGLVGIVLLAIAFSLYKWRTSYIRKKERAKTHIQQLKAEEYKNQFELEQISNYFSSSMADKENIGDVLWDVAKNCIGKMNYPDCMIYMWNEAKTKMIQVASYGPKGNPQAIHAKIFDVLPGQGVVGQVMLTKEPVLISDTRKDTRYRVDDISRLSEICVPIIHNDELIGIIDSEHPDENHFKERDIKILTTIATLVGNKIKQIESLQSLEMKKNEIAFINQQLAEAQLSALQAQMNPHFIFNSLNSIKRMILTNEQQNASRYLSKFAQMIRITLNQSKEIFTTLQENVEYLENYLTMEKLRFDDSFTFRIMVDDAIDKEEILVPTLMIQPLAENAIWHGLIPKEGEKRLLIHFSIVNDMISCTIRDNGIGIKRAEELKQNNRAQHQSVGLNNLRNRIKIMNEKYNTGCTLEIKDLGDHFKHKTGTCVILQFNSITNKPSI